MIPQALEPYSILIVLVFAMAMFIWNRFRFDVVALSALAVAVIIGAVPYRMVYTGLNNSAVITVAFVMIISDTLNKSGIINHAVDRLGLISKSATLHITIMCLITAVLSAFMNNVGAMALLMPVAIKTSLENKRSPAVILMPMALASAMGGLTTLIGTPPNLLISNFRQQATGQRFAMFDFGHAGLVIAAVGVLFIVLIGWRLLPIRKSHTQAEDIFQIEDYIFEAKIPESNNLIDTTVDDFNTLIDDDYELIGVIRNRKAQFRLKPTFEFEKNDVLIIEATSNVIEKLLRKTKCELVGDHKKAAEHLRAEDMATLEAVIPPASRLEGRSWQQARVRSRFSMSLIAIARKGKPFKSRINHVKLTSGDVILVQGAADTIEPTIQRLGLLPLIERGIQLKRTTPRSYLPLLIFIAAIVCAALQWIPVQVAFGGAVLAMALTRSIPVRQLYDSIEWPIIVLLAAMIPIGNALVTTGGTDLLTHSLLSLGANLHPFIMLALILIVTMTLSDFMNNAVTTVVMAPIAISIARALGLSVDPFLMAVAVGASCSFLTPIGHQNNTLVMGPGGYAFSDYIRMGLPLEMLVIVTSLPMILWAWPF